MDEYESRQEQDFAPHRPDRLWGPLTLFSDGYLKVFL
jgi:hypothetical protein